VTKAIYGPELNRLSTSSSTLRSTGQGEPSPRPPRLAAQPQAKAVPIHVEDDDLGPLSANRVAITGQSTQRAGHDRDLEFQAAIFSPLVEGSANRRRRERPIVPPPDRPQGSSRGVVEDEGLADRRRCSAPVSRNVTQLTVAGCGNESSYQWRPPVATSTRRAGSIGQKSAPGAQSLHVARRYGCTAPHGRAFVTPTTIGRGAAYQIVSTIGRGGFATSTRRKTPLLIDTWRSRCCAGDPGAEGSCALPDEARASARLAGTNIV